MLTHVCPSSSSNNDVVLKLENENYRMEKPEYATDHIYTVMKQCWHNDPENRPPFCDIEAVSRRRKGENFLVFLSVR